VEAVSEHGNDPAYSVIGSKFLRQLNGYQLDMKDSAPWET
jgi:hypothetical protein